MLVMMQGTPATWFVFWNLSVMYDPTTMTPPLKFRARALAPMPSFSWRWDTYIRATA